MAQAKQSVLDLPWQRLNAQLRAALGQDSERLDENLLDGFTVQISAALSTYAWARERLPARRAAADVMDDVTRVAMKLRRQVERGLRQLHHYEHATARHYLSRIAEMIDEMGAAREGGAIAASESHGPGNPHQYRRALRIAVFRGLQDLGVPLRRTGAAGRVLAEVLAEADHIDGVKAGDLRDFKSTIWRKWLEELAHDDGE